MLFNLPSTNSIVSLSLNFISITLYFFFLLSISIIKYNFFDFELKSLIESHGGKVIESISKNTTFLINNDITSTSSKNKEAQ